MVLGTGSDEAALEKSYSVAPPLDAVTAAELLAEARQIMDRLGVVFFLRQGTCLGAIRDGGFISWDDDIDIGSIIGLHGVTEETIDSVVSAFGDNGYFVRVEGNDRYVNVSMMKSSTRIDWAAYRIIGDSVFHYPGILIPAKLFTRLKEIDFMDAKFLVPDPPEEYLRCKYGEEWRIPKKAGFDKDVLELVVDAAFSRTTHGPRSFLSKKWNLFWRATRLRILDHEDHPVSDAQVVIAGVGDSKTNRHGISRFYLPDDDWYAVVITYGDRQELLYQERMARGRTYVYRADPTVSDGRLSILSTA